MVLLRWSKSLQIDLIYSRLFAKNGYRVALLARDSSGETQKLAQELNDAGGEVRY